MIKVSGSASLWLARGGFPVPPGQKVHSISQWDEFGVFGLSLYDDQHPWFVLIEILQIAMHRHRNGLPVFPGLLDPDGVPAHEQLSYDLPLNESLRHLLFRDKEVARLASQPFADPGALWGKWLEHASREFPNLDFGYLRHRFADDFLQFAEALDLLRSSEVEKYSGRRWTSRHLLPLGQAMMFADVKPASGNYDLDRRFFQRTGELVYLMLNRSRFRDDLAGLLCARLLDSDRPWNRLARKFQPDHDRDMAEAPKMTSQNVGYLPVPHMSVYDRLAQDWIALLKLDSLQIEDCLDSLMRLTGLHEVTYIVERAADEAGWSRFPPFPLDMCGSVRGNAVQSWSSNAYKTHKVMPVRAVEAFARRFETSEEWTSISDDPTGRAAAAAALRSRFLWSPPQTLNPANLPAPAEQIEAMLAQSRKRSHPVGSALTNHARRIGLLRAQRRSGTWYSPQDGLIEALVLANVTGPLELSAFLRLLKDRYHVVVGPEEASEPNGDLPAPREALARNEQRFEERLHVLGLIDRKSDDCAFVINPFHRETRGTVHAAA